MFLKVEGILFYNPAAKEDLRFRETNVICLGYLVCR